MYADPYESAKVFRWMTQALEGPSDHCHRDGAEPTYKLLNGIQNGHISSDSVVLSIDRTICVQDDPSSQRRISN